MTVFAANNALAAILSAVKSARVLPGLAFFACDGTIYAVDAFVEEISDDTPIWTMPDDADPVEWAAGATREHFDSLPY